jgi:hypothetical protein
MDTSVLETAPPMIQRVWRRVKHATSFVFLVGLVDGRQSARSQPEGSTDDTILKSQRDEIIAAVRATTLPDEKREAAIDAVKEWATQISPIRRVAEEEQVNWLWALARRTAGYLLAVSIVTGASVVVLLLRIACGVVLGGGDAR